MKPIDKLSLVLLPTIKSNSSLKSSNLLLLNGGFIRQQNTGFFTLLPFAQRVLSKISAIIHFHLKSINAQNVIKRLIRSQCQCCYLRRIGGKQIDGTTQKYIALIRYISSRTVKIGIYCWAQLTKKKSPRSRHHWFLRISNFPC